MGGRTNLSEWKERYQSALSAYADERDNFRLWQAQFDGDKAIPDGRDATSAYNFTRELIEAQIDSNIPQPSVQPRKPSERNRELADIIMAALRNELDRMQSEAMNDIDERLSRIMGGDVFLTEWDNSQKTHATVGELANRLVSPMEFIPQETVYDIERMDYFFLAFEETKTRIKAKYGKDVEQEGIDTTVSDRELSTADDLVTQIVCFYRDGGDVGCLSWAGDTVLMDERNYFARKDRVCANCGKTQGHGEKECICGSTEWAKRDREWEYLARDVQRSDGSIIPAISPVREGGQLVYEDYEEPVIDPVTGMQFYNRVLQDGVVIGEEPITQTMQRPAMEPTRIPYYTPKGFPVAVRKNTSVYQRFFGESDCAVIREQQIQANKAMTKIDRKIRTTSEFFTKPEDLPFKFSNEEGAILNLDSPQQMQMIKAVSLQFDMIAEYNVIERAYYQAKSVLGITDTFQGKADPTATSGRAKEIQVAQAAGIQKSKRTMKNAAYADLFRNMFWFLLAFADEPRAYTTMDERGQQVEKIFNRYDFLEQDEYGNWYYNDDFLFSVDEAGSMQTDKQFLLEDVRTDFGMGAFGNPTEPETILMYWKEKEVLGYPNAKRMVRYWQEKADQQQEMLAMQSQMMKQGAAQPPLMGGGAI